MNAGELVTPTLRLSRVLGQGGMGSVWVADHLALGTQVAVKFMAPKFKADAGLVERFHREAMAAAQIRSPHVAQVFDHGVTEGGALYIVMELLEGEDLRCRVKRLGPLPPGEVARIVAQTAKALGRAHRLGIIHRDIKPANIFIIDVEGEPFVKVFDFGVAKSLLQEDLHMTTSGDMIGTPLYMSPEQFQSARTVDLRADLWSLAVSAYFALTGQLPFTGEHFASVLMAIREGVFKPPSAVRPGLPPEIDAWMVKALHRDPAERFGSAREFAEALWAAAGEIARAPMASISEIAAVEPALPPAAQVPSPPKSGRLMLLSYLRRQRLVEASPMVAEADTVRGAMRAQGATLAALASTGLNARSRRSPLVILMMVLMGLLAIIVSLLLFVWTSSSDSPGLAAQPAGSVAPPSTSSSAVEIPPIAVASSTPTAAPTVDSRAPAAPTPTATAIVGASAQKPASPSPLVTTTATPSTTGPHRKPTKPKDTIGF